MSSRPLPLRPPGMAAIAIFIFVFVWNDYLVGTVLATTEDMKTVQKGIVPIHHYRIRQLLDAVLSFYHRRIHSRACHFAAFQRWFIAGVTSGGVSDPDASRVSRLARL